MSEVIMNNLTPELRKDILELHKKTSLRRYDEVFEPQGVKNKMKPINLDIIKQILNNDESFINKFNRCNSIFSKSIKDIKYEQQSNHK